MNLERSRQK